MNTRKFAMNYGAYLGLGLVVIFYLSYILELDVQKAYIPFVLRNILIVYALVYAINTYKNKINNGFISYNNSLKLGTSILVYASFILAFYNFIFITYINPDFIEYLISIQEQTILNSDPEISDEKLDMILNFMRKIYEPIPFAVTNVVQYSFIGFFYSLIISFFLKKEDPNLII